MMAGDGANDQKPRFIGSLGGNLDQVRVIPPGSRLIFRCGAGAQLGDIVVTIRSAINYCASVGHYPIKKRRHAAALQSASGAN
jgi:hypothetical protein